MDILIFGTGEFYQKWKNSFKDDVKIIGLIDNDIAKQGHTIDEHRVYSPSEVLDLQFDYIFLMSSHYPAMKEQLYEIGVDEKNIIDISRRGKLIKTKPAEIYGEISYKKNTNIIVFSHSLTSTGAQNALFEAVLFMKEIHPVVVVSGEDGYQREKYLEEGVPVIISEDILSDAIFRDLADSASSFWVNTVWLCVIADEIRAYGKRIIWWLHETISLQDISRREFRRIADNKSIRLLSVSPLIDENIHNLYGEDINVVRLFFGIRDYTKGVHRKTVKERIRIACLGGISKIKGQDLLIEAVGKLEAEKRNKLDVIIAGKGAFSDYENKLIKESGCIRFVGEIPHEEIPLLYESIDGIVCCSRKESMSIAVAEACMNGKFSIVSNSVGIAEMMSNEETALIFENEDILGLTDKLEYIIDNPSRAYEIGILSRNIYERYFTIEHFQAELRNIMQWINRC